MHLLSLPHELLMRRRPSESFSWAPLIGFCALTNTIDTNTDKGGSTILPTGHAKLPDNGSHSFSSRIVLPPPPVLPPPVSGLTLKKRPGAPIESIPRCPLLI